MIPLSPAVATLLYGVLIALALVIVKVTKLETVDRSGYVDSFRTPDKWQHAGLSFILTLAAVVVLGVPPRQAFALTFAAGLGWELLFCDRWSHRWRDLVVDAGGCLLAVLLLALGAAVV